jgi:DNA repair exonuclease SbcCD ATPase subunit
VDNGYDMGAGEKEVSFFEPYDFAFLGDIHQQQFLGYRNDINGISKPWIGYNGAFLQQNFGESIKKGYYVWDIRDKNDWDVEWKKLINLAPFVTLNWAGSVEQTLEDFEQLHGDYAYMPNTRYRIVSDVLIPQVQTKQFIELLKNQHKAAEVIFKTDLVSNMETVSAHGIEINKKSLSQDPVTMTKLYEKYMESNKDLFRITKEEQEEDAIDAAEIIKDYCQRLFTDEKDNSEARNVQWSIKEFKFDNLFGYGEGNTINFDSLHNIVGILGNNRVGKSSIVGGLMYVLYNTTDRGSVKNSLIINTNKNYCSGAVRINVAGEEYLIERKTTRSPPKKGADEDKAVTSLNLWLIETNDGQEVKISKNGITRDDTDKNIRNLIGNSDDFLLTAFASQNNINRFIENKATKRKEILNRFLELDIFEKLFSYAKTDYQNLDNQSKNYSAKDWAKLIERTEKEIEKHKEDITSFEDKINNSNIKRDQLNLWIASHESTAKSIDTTSVGIIETKIIALKNQFDATEARIKTNKGKLKDKQKEKATIEKAIENIDIKVLEADLISFESLKDNFNKLQNEYDANTAELKTQQKAVTKLTMVPCGDKFPNCHYIKDAHKAKETIEVQTSLVQKLSTDLNNCKGVLEQYVSRKLRDQISSYKDNNVKILMLSSEISRIEDKIEHDNKDIEVIKRDLKDLETKLKGLKKSINLIESEEFIKKKQQMDTVVSELSILNSKKNDLLIGLGGKQDFLLTTMSEQTQGKDLIRRLKLFDSIQSAFSKNGIPAMVLKNQLPAINIEMAKVLDGLIDFTVSLETDTTSNVMDVILEDSNNRKRQIELCSGMEKTICSLALRVALGNLSSLPRPDIFILDESFSALDEINLQKAMELLSLFRGYFKSVLVISHQTQIKEISDMIIEIKNNGIESTVEQ